MEPAHVAWFAWFDVSIGERDKERVEEVLDQSDLPIANDDIGGRRPRTLFLDMRSGVTTMRFVDNARLEI